MENRSSRITFALISMFTVLTLVTTSVIRIPIPATTGYFNLGDVFIIGAGLLLGPIGGFIAGAVGAGLADFIGYPQFVLATFVTKGIEGLIVGLVAQGGNPGIARVWTASLIGGLIVVAGYFIFEAFVYPALGRSVPFFAVTNFQDAVVEVVPNAVQGFIGASGGVGLWRAFSFLRKK